MARFLHVHRGEPMEQQVSEALCRREIDTLLAVARAFSLDLPPQESLRRVAREVARSFTADMVGAYALDERREALVPVAGYHVPKHLLTPFLETPFPIANFGLRDDLWARRQPVWTSDAMNDTRFDHAVISHLRPGSLLIAPTLVRGEIIGMLFVNWWKPGRSFTAAELRLLEGVASQVGLALENADLVRRLTNTISASLDLDTVLQHVTEAARDLCGSDFARIALWEPDSDAMVFRHGVGTRYGAYDALRIERDKGMGGLAWATGRPCRTDNRLVDPRFGEDYLDLVRTEQTVSDMVVPIRTGGRIAGLIFVDNRSVRPFTDRDETILLRLADHAATAISNAQLFANEQAARARAEASERALRESEARYRGLVEGSIQGILIHRDFVIRFANPALACMFGYATPQALIGRDLWTLIAPADRARVEQDTTARIRGEAAPSRYEFQGVRRDGALIWLEVLPSLVPFDGRPSVLAALLDITERKRAEEAARESAVRFEALIEHSSDAVCVLAADATILYVSPSTSRILGYASDEFAGRNGLELVHPDDIALASSLLHQVLERPEATATGQFRLRHKDGSHRRLEVVGTNLLHERSVTGVVCNFRDVTEREAAETQLREQREALYQSEKLAAMGSLLAGVAHELNNPLSVIVGRAQLIRKASAESLLGRQTEQLQEAAERCARIVRNFLALARRTPSERRRVSLDTVVRAAVELLAYPLRVDDIRVTLNLTSDLPALWADPDQLHQGLVNLISNAHQAMREAPRPRGLTVTSRFDRKRQRILLEVADTGPGVPVEIRSRIFEPFFTTKPPGQGTGLGLALCQSIVEGHNGTIRLASAPGKGAVFVVELPVEAPTQAPGDAGALEAAPPPVRGKRILVVDDEPDVLAILDDLLAGDGSCVDTAANGAAALAKLKKGSYDVILSDLRMPVLDGRGLYEALEERRLAPLDRIVLVTGDALSPETEEFFNRTGVPKLAKPFSLDEVRRVIHQALGGSV